MRSISIPEYIKKHLKTDQEHLLEINQIRKDIEQLGRETPLVSVVIPAYNEQHNILRTLSSLSRTQTAYPVEIIVVDNNSTDETRDRVEKSGAIYILEKKKGVQHARSTGLKEARGTYVVSGDADTIYSPDWVNQLVSPLIHDEQIACVHGKFAFIPEDRYNRGGFFLYETLGDLYKKINCLFKDPAIYVYGCSSAFRKAQAVEVGAYDHPPGSNEDGYLGLKLRNKFGKLVRVSQKKSIAWTSSRKFVTEGTLIKRVFNKMRRIISLM